MAVISYIQPQCLILDIASHPVQSPFENNIVYKGPATEGRPQPPEARVKIKLPLS